MKPDVVENQTDTYRMSTKRKKRNQILIKPILIIVAVLMLIAIPVAVLFSNSRNFAVNLPGQNQNQPNQDTLVNDDKSNLDGQDNRTDDKNTTINPQPILTPDPVSKESQTKYDPLSSNLTATPTKIPVLMYHSIVDPREFGAGDTLGASLRVSPEVLDAQLSWLKTNNYTTITIDELLSYSQGKSILPQKPILLTFDDGWNDNFVNALPLLKKHDMKGNFAIITGLVGTDPYMNWPQIQTLHNEGMGIMSHSVRHCTYAAVSSTDQFGRRTFLPTPPAYGADAPCPSTNKSYQMPDNVVLADLKQSKQTLEAQIGVPVSSIVYPFGNYNAQVMESAKEAGYLMGFTTEAMNNEIINFQDPLRIGRTRVGGQATVPLMGFFATQ